MGWLFRYFSFLMVQPVNLMEHIFAHWVKTYT